MGVLLILWHSLIISRHGPRLTDSSQLCSVHLLTSSAESSSLHCGCRESSQTTSLMECWAPNSPKVIKNPKQALSRSKSFSSVAPNPSCNSLLPPTRKPALFPGIPLLCFPFPITSHPSPPCFCKTLSTHGSWGGRDRGTGGSHSDFTFI